jgi:putative phosphoserine phosphatase/1-acylglycerol-3-phosphate O-acyltransferase
VTAREPDIDATPTAARAPTWTLDDALTEIASSPRGEHIGAFFDFDGTLIHGYSVYAFAQDRIVRRQVGALEAVRAARVGVEYALGRVGYDRLIGLAADAWRGRPTKELEALGERLFREVLADRVYPEARALVAAHRDRGHTVTITTSATYYQVAPIARALGIDHIVCQELEAVDGVLTGEVKLPTLWGPGKTMAARRFAFDHSLDFDASFFYADGDEDLALMSEIGRPRPTNPGKRLAAEAVTRGWPILRFASRGTPGWPVVARNVGGFLVAAPVTTTAAAAAGAWQRSRRHASNVATTLLPDIVLGLNAVHIDTTGEPNLDGLQNAPAVIVARQRSRIDAFVVAKLLRRDCRLVVDRALAQDPVLGTIGRLFDVEFAPGVDEPDAERLRHYRALLERGTSIVFLVGPIDRPDEAPALRSGPLRLAAGAAVPIVPLVVRDSDRLVTRRPPVVRPGTIHVEIGAPITANAADLESARAAVAGALA